MDVVFGCETKETGEIFNQEADGILGLGNSEVSMVNQVGHPSVTHLAWWALIAERRQSAAARSLCFCTTTHMHVAFCDSTELLKKRPHGCLGQAWLSS